MNPSVTWETLDWRVLEALRARFLAGGAGGGGGYWRSRADLANYDFTYARRIGWKWDAVLRELDSRGWQPPAGPVLDWGCGSGVAGRRVVGHYGAGRFGALALHDRAGLAVEFAAAAARAEFPGLDVRAHAPDAPCTTLLVSHVLNELDDPGRAALRALLARAAAVLWVEPGTFADSRALIGFREELLSAGFDAVAPCTHRRGCGMLHARNAPHWCHHFAAPPPEVLADGRWVQFARRAGIDLRAVPYSFLVLARRAPPPAESGWARVIGRPRVYKGYAKILECAPGGVAEVGVQARDHAELFRRFKKDRGPTLWRGREAGGGWQIVEEVSP